MDSLHNREGVLLMLAYSMHQDNLITNEEKGQLKGTSHLIARLHH
jgi:hypothetical protein